MKLKMNPDHGAEFFSEAGGGYLDSALAEPPAHGEMRAPDAAYGTWRS